MKTRAAAGCLLVAMAVLGGCAQLPKQAFNRDAATHIRSIVVTQAADQDTYRAAILGHPAAGFGLVGALVAAADMQAKSTRLTASIDPKEARLQTRFAEKLAASLERAGYESTVLVLPTGIRDEEILAHVKKSTSGDATVIVGLTGAYWAAGPSTDYQPRLIASVRAVDTTGGAILYQDTLTYGSAVPNMKTIHFPSDSAYRFGDIDILVADPTKAREGLVRGLDALAEQIAADLKRN